MTLPPERWRKSSRSGQETSCVEIGHTLTAVRDSKNPAGGALTVDVGALLAAVKGGQLGC